MGLELTLVQILMVVANIQVRSLKNEGRKTNGVHTTRMPNTDFFGYYIGEREIG